MQSDQSRILEKPYGVGTVTQNGVTISQVSYDLEVTQTYRTFRTHSGSNIEEPGVPSVSGTITSKDEVDLSKKENLILHLADGRTMGFLVESRFDRSWRFLVKKGSGTPA
ncbi:MAG TPA: hypothetical protein VNE17_08560 [Nitrolancea sp.]|nr:hypothetical protein [Nitrolancea sp.]